jgi:hypothetical protein
MVAFIQEVLWGWLVFGGFIGFCMLPVPFVYYINKKGDNK